MDRRRVMRMIKCVLISFMLMVCFVLQSYAADITPTCINMRIPGGYRAISYYCEWRLEINRVASGDSDIAIDVGFCIGYKKLEFTTSGGVVAIDFDIKEDNYDKITTSFSSATAETVFKNSVDPIKRLYVTSTITNGQVDNITLSCVQQ